MHGDVLDVLDAAVLGLPLLLRDRLEKLERRRIAIADLDHVVVRVVEEEL